MTQNTLSGKAMEVMEHFLRLPIPDKDISCPYYNNRRGAVRAGLRVLIGKGEATEIVEEAKLVSMKEKIDLFSLPSPEIKKFLVDHRIGIDCSGLAYYILNAESIEENFGPLKKRIAFPQTKNILRIFWNKLRPVENTGVLSLAHPKNSRQIGLGDVQPGDFIIMLSTGPDKTYNHVLVIWKTEYEEDALKTIQYVHSFAWPTDGKYNHGVRKGTIKITDKTKPLAEQSWEEQKKTGKENVTEERAHEAGTVSIRRLNWF